MNRPNIFCYDHGPTQASLLKEVLYGLSRRPKRIPPKFFYDTEGSRLFDVITQLPEYYLTRTEISLLRAHGSEIASLAGAGCQLIEFGSGSSIKVRLLLEALRPSAYIPIDISRTHLFSSAAEMAAAHPYMQVHAICADYTRPVLMPEDVPPGRRMIFFPGSSIGNFEPDDAVKLLERIRAIAGEDGALIIGVDLKKDSRLLNAAYNDGAEVTAHFNLNLLVRINRELGADFAVERFRHHAFYNEDKGRIEMHLVSQCGQNPKVNGQCFAFARGEAMHTENSYKYSIDEFQALARQAGLYPVQTWLDQDRLFSIHYLAVS